MDFDVISIAIPTYEMHGHGVEYLRHQFNIFSKQTFQDFEVVISDQKMPTLSGVEFFELIMPDHPNPVRMLLTGHADIDAVIDAINKGQIYKYISKPWNEAELKRLVEEASNLYQFRTAQDMQASDYSKRLYSAQDKLESLIIEIKSSNDLTEDKKDSYIETINGAISLLQVPT